MLEIEFAKGVYLHRGVDLRYSNVATCCEVKAV